MHQCSKDAKLGKIVESGGKATCSRVKQGFVEILLCSAVRVLSENVHLYLY